VNLVHPDSVEIFMQRVGDAYHRSTGMQADFYVVGSADGAR
jgi:galactokinase